MFNLSILKLAKSKLLTHFTITNNQTGALSLFLIVAVVGILGFGELGRLFPIPVSRAASGPNTVTIRNDGAIVINGTPTFLTGFYHDADDVTHQGAFLAADATRVADAGYNVMHPSITELENTTQYRTTAAQRGLFTIAQFYKGPTASPAWSSIDGTVTTLKNDPSVIAWDIADDFNLSPDKTITNVTALHNRVKANAPNHLTYGAGTGANTVPLATWKDAMDIIGIEAYPISNLDEGYETAMENSIGYYLHARQVLPANKPIFALPQTFKWGHSGARWPTSQELRNMAFGGLVARMNGVIFYTMWMDNNNHLPTDNPTLWAEAQKLGADLNKLKPALLNGKYTGYDSNTNYTLNPQPARIHAATWEYQGQAYVVVINTKNTGLTANIPLPVSVSGTPQPFFPGDGRYATGLTLNGTTLTGSVAGNSVHVYQLTSSVGTATPTPTLSSPTPSPLPGDIDGNNKVDIFDYNLLLTDFGSTSGVGLRSDINNSGKVDIFDYNLLLINFGKHIP